MNGCDAVLRFLNHVVLHYVHKVGDTIDSTRDIDYARFELRVKVELLNLIDLRSDVLLDLLKVGSDPLEVIY